jgi:protein-S-isoprenylcysteine O-methyltransferase Ste14
LIPPPIAALDLVSAVAAAGLGYYAAKMYLQMRFGRLEKSWQMVTLGAGLFSLGFIVLTVQDLSSSSASYYFTLDFIGTALATIGMILLLVGFRSHYRVWSLKYLKKKEPKMSQRSWSSSSA